MKFWPVTYGNQIIDKMSQENKDAYQTNVNALLVSLYRSHQVDAERTTELLEKACESGMLFYPNGKIVTSAQLKEITADKKKMPERISDFVVVNYNPLNKTTVYHAVNVSDKNVSVDQHALNESEFLEKQQTYIEKQYNKEQADKVKAMDTDQRKAYFGDMDYVFNGLYEDGIKLGSDFLQLRLQAAIKQGLVRMADGNTSIDPSKVEFISRSPAYLKNLVFTRRDKEHYRERHETYRLIVKDGKVKMDYKQVTPLEIADMEKALTSLGKLHELPGLYAQALNPRNEEEIEKYMAAMQEYGYTVKNDPEAQIIRVSPDKTVYLYGNPTPIKTPEELMSVAIGIEEPKKPSGFFAYFRELWHTYISPVEEFTKYEQDMKEYEITKYYTCVKAGFDVAKPDAVTDYENELAVDLYLDANFDHLADEWGKLVWDNGLSNPLADKTIRQEVKEKLLKDPDMYKFISDPATQKCLSLNYGKDFKIFGKDGRKPDAVSEETMAKFVAAGELFSQRVKWGMLSEYAGSDTDVAVYGMMKKMAECDSHAASDVEFMEKLNTFLRRDTPISNQVFQKLQTLSKEQLSDFRYNCTTLNRYDAPFDIEMTAADQGLLTPEQKESVLKDKCAHWLKPLDELLNTMTGDEKAFFADFKAAFESRPDIAHHAMHEIQKFDEQSIQRLAPAVSQYAKVKEYASIKSLGNLGVLEVVAHNNLFGHYTPRDLKATFQKTEPNFTHSDFWKRVKVDEWAKPVEDAIVDETTKAYVKDLKAALNRYPNIREEVMKERAEPVEASEGVLKEITAIATAYSQLDRTNAISKEKIGCLSTLAIMSQQGHLSQELATLVDGECKKRQEAAAKAAATALKTGKIGKPHRDQHFSGVSLKEARANTQRIVEGTKEKIVNNLQEAYDVPREVIESGWETLMNAEDQPLPNFDQPQGNEAAPEQASMENNI